ncbi:NAD(P)H-hydrate epimerase [bacterium]|nr:NAD(P)H-hydrate epimerase [bacterium]
MTTPPEAGSRPPAITPTQMREVDRIMVDDLGIELLQMMENAGRNLALLAIARFKPASVTVLAGPGGNGGGGMAAARHLANRGIPVSVTLVKDDPTPVPSRQLATLRRMGVEIAASPAPAGLVLDAVIGYSIDGDPRGRAAELIEWVNDQDSRVLALDTPSGLDLTTGKPGSPTVEADATMTLALPKQGLYETPEVVGELYLADISVPPSVYSAFGIDLADPFTEGPIVRIS